MILSARTVADVPDVATLVAPWNALFCQARDAHAGDVEALAARFLRVAEAASRDWLRYAPERPLDGRLLLEWLRQGDGS